MAATSRNHISTYSSSVCAIAAVFWPKKFVAINTSSLARLASTAGSGTVATNAPSKASAASRACNAATSAWAAAMISHCT